ncbi:MAG: hypothetical protein KDB53_13165 [Planctomycetes bacterium]|nr:hypothetical protein [Planctomycetota bacterium]
MKRPLPTLAILALAVLAMSAVAPAQRKPKIKPTVTFASTWDAAIEEAKLLNVPIVVHSHGFY